MNTAADCGCFCKWAASPNGQKFLGGWDWLHSQISCKKVLRMFLELFNTNMWKSLTSYLLL